MVTSGTRLGPYEVVSPLGAGGMGEVYVARDTRLERSVAIKILPAEFAQNAQLRARFEREAKSISQLAHPNICTLYDVGDGYIVMELLDGQTLAERIAKGPLPLDLIVRIGSEIANALHRAHKSGIVHRDLKPSNVMLTKSGAKLLDFGLAKEGVANEPLHDPEVATATLRRAITEEGTLLGTFQYMAPEQVEGAPVDARTDIFALGAVLYEMATGRRAFEGRSKASLIAAILTVDPPPISALQPASPEPLDRIIRTCLAKEPDDRFQSAHDVALALRWLVQPAADAPSSRASTRPRLAWTLAALMALAAATAGFFAVSNFIRRRNAPAIRTTVLPPEKQMFAFDGAAAPPAISPDGKKIVFGAADGSNPSQLFVRTLESPTPQALPGTARAMFPFWSPDGRFVAFFADGKLKKISVSGGGVVELCDVADGRGGSWSSDGNRIVFAGRTTPIFVVPSGGGTPRQVTTLETGAVQSHRWPVFLPDGRHFLFLSAVSGFEDPQNAIAVGSIEGGPHKVLLRGTDNPLYFDGYLLFTRNHVLMAQAFDTRKLMLTGEPITLREQQVESSALFSRSMMAVSPAGTLVYQPGAAVRDARLTWYDRSGKQLGDVAERGVYNSIILSPDHRKVLVAYGPRPQSNIWQYDLENGSKTRLTFGQLRDQWPLLSPDGTKLAYVTMPIVPATGRAEIHLKDLVTGADQVIVEPPSGYSSFNPTSWSSDGRIIFFTAIGSSTSGADIYWFSLAERKPRLFLGGPGIQSSARLSPDGRWVAYMSNDTGRSEIYVAPFPPTGAKWQISESAGWVPRWRADGRELLFMTPGSSPVMTAVSISLTSPPAIGKPTPLFSAVVGTLPPLWDMSGDAQRFLIDSKPENTPPPAPLTVVQHFGNELRAVTTSSNDD